MCITGCVLVFHTEIDRALNPDLFKIEKKDTKAPIHEWLSTLDGMFPDSYVSFVYFPKSESSTVIATLQSHNQDRAPNSSSQSKDVFIDPYTAEVVGTRTAGLLKLDRKHFANVLYELHMDLLLGAKMFWFLGLVAFLWLLDHVVSVVISFTTLSKWKRSFRIRFSKVGFKRIFDIHRAGGLWLFPVTLMFAISALYFNWYGYTTAVVSAISPITPRYIFTHPSHASPTHNPPIDMQSAINIAESIGGNEQTNMVRFIYQKQVYEAKLFDTRDIDVYGRRIVVIDADSGQVLSDAHQTEGGAGNTFIAWMYPLHSGKAFGWIGRFVVFLSGVMLTIVVITGIKIWLKKRTAQPH